METERHVIIKGKKYLVEEIQHDESGAVRSVAYDRGGNMDLLVSADFAAENEPDDGGALDVVDDPGAFMFHAKHFETGSTRRNSKRNRISDQILTSKEAQEVLGIKSSRLSKHVVAGEIKQIKRGVFLKDDVAALYQYRQKNLS